MFHILAGGVFSELLHGTDYVTSPMVQKLCSYTVRDRYITVVIRVYGAYPEGVSFAILIMNAFVPLMNAYIKPRRFGEEVKHG
jgi:electron transport complex protein RnfD